MRVETRSAIRIFLTSFQAGEKFTLSELMANYEGGIWRGLEARGDFLVEIDILPLPKCSIINIYTYT